MDYIEFFLRTLQIPDIREALEGGDGEGEGRVRGRETHHPSAPLSLRARRRSAKG